MTPALAAAQRGVSPQYTLEVLAGPRSSGWKTGGAAWVRMNVLPGGLAGWNAQSIATDAVAFNGGVARAFLSWSEGKAAVQVVGAADLANSAVWQGAPVRTAATFTAAAGVVTPKPALAAAGGTLWLYWLLPSGSISVCSSSDGGVTWGSASTVYGGGDAEGDLFAAYLPAHDIHLLHFATRSDVRRLRGASRAGVGAWSIWPAHAGAGGWSPAGVVVTGALEATLLAWARTTAPHEHYLAAVGCTLTAGGGLAQRDVGVETVWLVGGETTIRPALHALGPGLGGWLHCCHEQSAGKAYLCAGAIEAGTGGCRIEEPAVIEATPLPTLPLERHLIPVEGSGRTLLVGLGLAYQSAHLVGDVTAGGDGVVGYRLVWGAQGGVLELHAAPGALAGCAPGWGLWLTRRCAPAGGGEAEGLTLGFRVVRVEQHADGARITALDAAALLESTAARRSLEFTPWAMSAAGAVERLAAWAGLGATVADVAGSAPLAQWGAGEGGGAALRRLLRMHAVQVGGRSAAGAQPQIVVGARRDLALETFGAGGHPLIEQVTVADARTPALAVAQGLAVRGAPQEGEEWALAAAGTAPPMVRAQPLVRLNRNWDETAQAAVAAALLDEASAAAPAGWFAAQGHLALEPGDCINVEGEVAYVQRIEEEWAGRRLVQRVAYGR